MFDNLNSLANTELAKKVDKSLPKVVDAGNKLFDKLEDENSMIHKNDCNAYFRERIKR